MSRPSLPRSVWVLGFVSLFMDLSSEIIHALLPLFVTVTLGASVAVLGAIDGVSEATASFAKLAGGRLSDRQQKRKPWIVAGREPAGRSRSDRATSSRASSALRVASVSMRAERAASMSRWAWASHRPGMRKEPSA